ncbi:MAG: signal peptidase II [Clostridiales bacterium]|nr:signal peptidase II [Clostridiales bacterium]
MTSFWATATGVFILDRLAKLLTLGNLAMGERLTLWRGVLEIRLTRNHGMALGLLSGYGIVNVALPVLVIALGWLAMRRYRLTALTRLATALVVGGFVGNLADRLTMGFVVDMVYFPWMPWYICNPADIAICAGVALLAVSLIFRPTDWRLKTEASDGEADHADR